MEDECTVVLVVFKEKGDVLNCGAYRGAKLLEHIIKIVERVMKGRIRAMENLDKIQFGFMLGKRTDVLYSI